MIHFGTGKQINFVVLQTLKGFKRVLAVDEDIH